MRPVGFWRLAVGWAHGLLAPLRCFVRVDFIIGGGL